MRKLLLLLLLFPFAFKAQTPPDKANNNVAAEKLNPYDKARADAKKLIEGYRQRVVNGTSMALMAQTYSQDPGSAKNGGRYEKVFRGQMVEEFEKAAFSLKPGEISEVFETKYGFHFIELIADNGETLDLRHILVTPK